MSSVKIGAALMALFLLPGSPARAEDDVAAAGQAFARAKKLFQQRDYVNAVAEFKRAYRLKPHHAVQCSIARCHDRMGQLVEAVRSYKRCLDEGGAESKRVELIRKELKRAEERITWVDVVSPGVGGTIYVDGLPVGLTPRRLPLDPGRHVLEVRREGARPDSITLQTGGGEQRTVTLVPKPRASQPPPRPEPDPKHKPEPGPATQPVTVTPPPPGRRRLSPAWFWTSTALTVALAGATTAFGILTLQRRSDYEGDPTEDGYQTFESYRLITNVMLGLSAAAAGSATVLYFYTNFSGAARDVEGSKPLASAVIGIRGSF